VNLAETTAAGMPLNVTWLSVAVGLNPNPRMVTFEPTLPLAGAITKIPIPVVPVVKRWIESRFPTAS
jgi:hypothetical protein